MDNAVPVLPQPRQFSTMAFRLAAFSVIPFTVMWCWSIDDAFLHVLPEAIGIGLVFASCFGTLMGFFLQGEAATVAVANRGGFIARLNAATAYLGYYPAKKKRNFLAYRPAFQSGVAAGWISVQVRDGQARIVGPRLYVRRLVKRLELV